MEVKKSLCPAVVLCGGFGTRLRSVVADRPKALAPIDGEPYLGHLLKHLHRQGVEDVILSTGYLGEMVEAYAGDGSQWGVRVRYVQEKEPLGTGGAIRFAADTAGLDGLFLAMNGDTFFSGSLAHLLAEHEARPEAQASLALVEVPNAARYGTVHTEPSTGAVTAFLEKQTERTGAAWINVGVYVLEPGLIASIPTGRKVSIERNVFPEWIGKGLYGVPFSDAVFLDIGTPEDFTRAAEVLESL